jgi:hypothetical protein
MNRESYDVPADAPVHRCRYCDRPFADEELLALHRGLDHPERIDAEEQAAFEAAYEAESDPLRRYRIAAVGVLVMLYFGLLIAFALLG